MQRSLHLNESPTPHPSRGAPLLRDWSNRYGPARRGLLFTGFISVMLLMVDPVRQLLRDGVGRWFHILLVSFLLTLVKQNPSTFSAITHA